MRHPKVIGSLMLGLLVVAGCGKKNRDWQEDPSAPNPQGGQPNPQVGQRGPNGQGGRVEVPAQFVAARQTFDANCARCHSTDPAGGGKGPGGFKGGPGGFKGKMSKGPNLARVGANPEHTREWFINYIRDPRSVNPKSRMPRQDKISESQLGALADYLVSLK